MNKTYNIRKTLLAETLSRRELELESRVRAVLESVRREAANRPDAEIWLTLTVLATSEAEAGA